MNALPLQLSSRLALQAAALCLALAHAPAASGAEPKPIPRLWTEAALRDWATPLANGLRANHYSEAEYYAAPVDNVRTYDVYVPGKEPKGYWEWLHQQEPQRIIDTEKLRTKKDWIAAGERVFQQLDVPLFRSTNAQAITFFRDPVRFTQDPPAHSRDGVVPGFRWVVEQRGIVKLGLSECAACHTRVLPDGRLLRGAPGELKGANEPLGLLIGRFFEQTEGADGRPISRSESDYQEYGVPWLKDDIHARLKTMSDADFQEIDQAFHPSTFPRTDGSPWFATKFPDLIGLPGRPFLDHTATHRNRGPEDIARYGILVTTANARSFGPHELMAPEQRRLRYRFSDEAMLALGRYIYSLRPPKSPHQPDTVVRRGQKIFTEEGCARCHDPRQDYTNHKLTLASGFVPPEDHPLKAHIMNRSVHTDPGLALKTRKGTGFYKVPSLRGLWYRGAFGHDASVATLEDWFDPRRLRDDYVPTGWKGPGVKTRAVPGHEYGLDLSPEYKAALIAFLKTL